MLRQCQVNEDFEQPGTDPEIISPSLTSIKKDLKLRLNSTSGHITVQCIVWHYTVAAEISRHQSSPTVLRLQSPFKNVMVFLGYPVFC
jgi:hypothetical protein